MAWAVVHECRGIASRALRHDDHAGALAMRDSSHERAVLRAHVHSMIPMHDSDSFWMEEGITRAPP
jgi:hypothetical protein